jgi:hypothetical protein
MGSVVAREARSLSSLSGPGRADEVSDEQFECCGTAIYGATI